MGATKSKSAALRARLNHPVLDSDGHLLEFIPVVTEYLQKTGGEDASRAFRHAFKSAYLNLDWYKLSPDQRRDQWSRRPLFTLFPRSTRWIWPPDCFRSCCMNVSTSWVSTTQCYIRLLGCMRRCLPTAIFVG